MGEVERKLGAALQAERERRGIDLPSLSEELKISEAHLEAIERGDKSALPSELYYQLFTRTYATHLGIDVRATIEAIKETLGLGPEDEEAESSGTEAPAVRSPETTLSARAEAESVGRSEGVPTALAVTVVIGLVVGLYGLFSVSERRSPIGTDNGTAIAAELTAAAEVLPAVAAAPPSGPPPELTLVLRPLEQSWATVLADGDTVIFQNLNPGRVYRAVARYRLSVSIGIPRNVRVELNGRPVDLVDPETRRISRVEINQANVARWPSPPANPPRPIKPQTEPPPAGAETER